MKGGSDASYSSSGIGIKLGPNLSLDLSSYEEPLTASQVSYISVSYMPPVFGWAPAKEREEVPRGFVRIIYPPTDFITYNENIKIQGYVRKGADVYINDIMAYVSW